MRHAEIFYDQELAGILSETEGGDYAFQYDAVYAEAHPAQFITFTMPVQKNPFISKTLFAFFEGLIPEGWLLEIAAKTWKINRNDRMGLLMACCGNCIGAVSVKPIQNEDEE
jgi:serine/threonine-protein kinase HipA